MNDENQMTRPIPVILFKTPSPSSSLDPYSQSLSSKSYQPTFIPVLEETYDTSSLVPSLEGGSEHWEGVIITSRRGAEGWVRAVTQSRIGTVASPKGKGKGRWDEVPLFTVGNASSDRLSESSMPPEYIPHAVGYEGDVPPKSAVHLIPHIIDRLPRLEGTYKKYLFVRGDKSTEVLQDELRNSGRIVEEFMVYRTTPRLDIGENINKFRESRRPRPQPKSDEDGDGKGNGQEGKGWLCFFSPSGAEVVLPHLKNPKDDEHGFEDGYWKGWKIFVIGETTKKYFEERGIKVDAVAERPNPQGLMDAVRGYDSI
ncbi:hypothetical protein I204_08057 [Kwoniella mangroviensis CBS 8886]|uniref:uncharacterized protein n=1 Tax=Kwoniella mangroviensis CBS 8507 TaxID=1296122 RepID=UPI00080D31D5|nr:uncharacterized protein I203_01583 [Kwoniella mangroviensis CBS 8507]OCF69719.1 hypothetical protein I203_01583 [Kwoniella mangroviensis CBS 8507]OCF71430.1 hypothetical protein I204_08057 [Kwoniella mangroviensis CBS 8886]